MATEHVLRSKAVKWETHCNACGKVVWALKDTELKPSVLCCQICKVFTHVNCVADLPACRDDRVQEPNLQHHWVTGTAKLSQPERALHCAVCEEALGSQSTVPLQPKSGIGMAHASCRRCERIVHLDCMGQLEGTCDNGPLASLKLWPECAYRPERNPNRILLLFVNPRSGGQVGDQVMGRAKRLLSVEQVVDLSQPGAMQTAFERYRGADILMLAAGGDGTGNWVLSTQKSLDKFAPLAVLPLGTGNDLANAFGFGQGYKAKHSLHNFLIRLRDSVETVPLDLWKVEGSVSERMGLMQNYASFGLDARIAFQFHSAREARPSLFKSQRGNKVHYGIQSLSVLLKKRMRQLTGDEMALCDQVRLLMDEKEVPLPVDAAGVIVLNIWSYMGGCRPWQDEGQSPNDGQLEVLWYRGLGDLQGLLTGKACFPLGQCRGLQVDFLDANHAQFDGEPFACQQGDSIRVSFSHQAEMVVPHD